MQTPTQIMRCLIAKPILTNCALCSMASHVPANPFRDLKLSSWDPLRGVTARALCPKCHCSRKFYCYTCYEVVGMDPRLVPRVQLPVKVDVLKHQQEVPGKSTAIHARILAPDNVSIHIFPEVPDYPKPSRVVLVFPKQDAMSVSQLVQQLRQQDALVSESATRGESLWKQIDRVVFVDSTWQQTHSIIRDERINALPCVRLAEAKTYFWRTQRKTSSHLATIEAVYHFFREMENCLSGRTYDGRYDDLLYFYAYQYGVVQQAQQDRAQQDRAQRDRAQQDRAQRDRAQQDRSQQDRSLQDRSLQDRSLQDRSLQDRSLQDRSLQDRSLQDRAQQDRVQRDRAQQDREKTDSTTNS